MNGSQRHSIFFFPLSMRKSSFVHSSHAHIKMYGSFLFPLLQLPNALYYREAFAFCLRAREIYTNSVIPFLFLLGSILPSPSPTVVFRSKKNHPSYI
jgi:hypothetical protein